MLRICKSCIYFKPISWTVISVLVFGNAWNDCSFLPFSLGICSSGSHDEWKVWLWSKPSLNWNTCSVSCYLHGFGKGFHLPEPQCFHLQNQNIYTHLPHWKVLTFLSLSFLSNWNARWSKARLYSESINCSHCLKSCFSLKVKFLSPDQPTLRVHFLQHVDLSWLSFCHFFCTLCNYFRISLCQSWLERKSWFILFTWVKIGPNEVLYA